MNTLFWAKLAGSAFLTLMGVFVLPSVVRANQIIDIDGGTASIEREAGSTEAARVGAELWLGDLLNPASGTVVTVQCNNATTRQVRRVSGLGTICPNSVADPVPRTGRGNVDFRLLWFNEYKYGTQVMEAMPILRLPLLETATHYQIQMIRGAEGPEEVIGVQLVNGGGAVQVAYEGEPLELGESYRLNITGFDKVYPIYTQTVLIRRLDLAEADRVAMLADQLATAVLSDEARALALVRLYLSVAKADTDPPDGSGLVWEAIAALEPIVAAGTETPFTHQQLGDLYLRVGLLDQAGAQYQQVLELTRRQDDVRTRAAAWVGLANIAAANGDGVAARESLELALVNYRVLGEAERVEIIENDWLLLVSEE